MPPGGRHGETEHRAVGFSHQAAGQLHPLLYKNNGVSIIRTQIFWATEVSGTFPLLEEGYEGALREYYKKQIGQLNMLISLLLGQLSKGDRQNLMILVSVLKLSVGQTRQSLKGACKYFISRFGGL